MLNLLNKIKKNPYIVNIVSVIVLIFFLLKPQNLKYFFETPLGRILFLLLITIVTYCNSLYGILFIVFLIGLYNSKVFEGLKNQNEIKPDKIPHTVKDQPKLNQKPNQSPNKKPKPIKMSLKKAIDNPDEPPKTVEGFHDSSRMLASEDNIRSKSSNNLINFDKSYFKSGNPQPSCSGIENFMSSPATY
jgi:hypothetical protein